jgi:hypothetical protein
MRFHQAALASAFLLAAASTASAQDVEATFSIKPSSTSVPCELTNASLTAITGAMTPEKIASLTGCPGHKVSTFEMLGQKTETYEFMDGRNRLQVTVQNNKILSRSLRRI